MSELIIFLARFEISQKLKQNKRKEASSSDGEIHDDKVGENSPAILG